MYTEGQQNYGYADLAQMNLEDARRVFAVYDEAQKGVIQATDLRTLMNDMGYSIANDISMDNYFTSIFETAKNGSISFDEFVKTHNEVMEMS